MRFEAFMKDLEEQHPELAHDQPHVRLHRAALRLFLMRAYDAGALHLHQEMAERKRAERPWMSRVFGVTPR